MALKKQADLQRGKGRALRPFDPHGRKTYVEAKALNMADRVCITGAAGFLGSHCVKRFLEEGYQVRATVRDASNTRKTEHLRAMGDVEIVSADLMTPGAFDAALEDCQVLIHAAAAVKLAAKDPMASIVRPSLEGTKNVLASAQKVGTIRRVLHTSSIAAILDTNQPPGHLFTEADWNLKAGLEDPYSYAKAMAERAAHDFVAQLPESERFELVALNPALVVGPILAPHHKDASPSVVRDLMNGAFPAAPRLAFGLVDVRDVMDAFVSALAVPDPEPRYILSKLTLSMPEIARILREAFPGGKIPKHQLPDGLMYVASIFDSRLSVGFLKRNLGQRRAIDNFLARHALGISYRPIDDSLRETAESLVAHGVVKV